MTTITLTPTEAAILAADQAVAGMAASVLVAHVADPVVARNRHQPRARRLEVALGLLQAPVDRLIDGASGLEVRQPARVASVRTALLTCSAPAYALLCDLRGRQVEADRLGAAQQAITAAQADARARQDLADGGRDQ